MAKKVWIVYSWDEVPKIESAWSTEEKANTALEDLKLKKPTSVLFVD